MSQTQAEMDADGLRSTQRELMGRRFNLGLPMTFSVYNDRRRFEKFLLLQSSRAEKAQEAAGQ